MYIDLDLMMSFIETCTSCRDQHYLGLTGLELSGSKGELINFIRSMLRTFVLIIPAKARDYGITGVGLSVCLFVCLFVTTITK